MILTNLGNIILQAEKEYLKENPNPNINKYITKSVNGVIVSELNPEYEKYSLKELRQISWERNNHKRAWIYEYLKENYPDEKYADDFLKFDKWGVPLREPSTKAKTCKYLKYGNRCVKKRNNNSCNYCCYHCLKPKVCTTCDCPFEEVKE